MAGPPLDLDAVQAFIHITELGSFTRAAEAMQTTQAAVSLKLKRLEDRLGCRLVEPARSGKRHSGAGRSVFCGVRCDVGAGPVCGTLAGCRGVRAGYLLDRATVDRPVGEAGLSLASPIVRPV